MRLHLSCIGKLKTGPEKLLAQEYADRISQTGKQAGLSSLQIHESSESTRSTAQQRQTEEEILLFRPLPAGSAIITFDERGKSIASRNFSDLIRKYAENGTADLAFLLGGPDGHTDVTRGKSAQIIALGAMTWPTQAGPHHGA